MEICTARQLPCRTSPDRQTKKNRRWRNERNEACRKIKNTMTTGSGGGFCEEENQELKRSGMYRFRITPRKEWIQKEQDTNKKIIYNKEKNS